LTTEKTYMEFKKTCLSKFKKTVSKSPSQQNKIRTWQKFMPTQYEYLSSDSELRRVLEIRIETDSFRLSSVDSYSEPRSGFEIG